MKNKLTLQDKIAKQEKIIDEMFSRIVSEEQRTDDFFTSFLFKKLEELFSIEVEYLGLTYTNNKKKNNIDFEIKPKVNESRFGAFQFDKEVPTVIIYSHHDNYDEIKNRDPRIRIKALKSFLKTLFHELKHLKQYLLTQQNVSNKNVLRNAKEFLIATSKKSELKRIYKNNHDSFAIEADAIRKGYDRVNKLSRNTYLYDDDIFSLKIHESNRDYNDIVVDNHVYNRDAYISFLIDYNIKYDRRNDFFKQMPILLKEYNEDGSKKSISVLMTNMKKELKEIELLEDENDKEQRITEIKEFYYELIYNRLVERDYFEIYEAINNHSKEELDEIINSTKKYFVSEKKRLLQLLKGKYEAKTTLNMDRTMHQYPIINHGKIKLETLNGTELISVDDYVAKLPNRDVDPNISYLYNTKGFKVSIPDNGIYILKDGTKISVSAFVEKIFLKEYQKMHRKSNIGLRYREVLLEHVKLPEETEYIINREKVNQISQSKDHELDDILKLPIMNHGTSSIDETMYESMKMIRDINNPDVMNNIRNYMLSNLAFDQDDYYYIFDNEQIKYFENIFKVAKLLNTNSILNPKKFDYYTGLRFNPVIIEINDEIKRYNKISNREKGVIKL